MRLYCSFTDLQKQLLRPTGTPFMEPLKSFMVNRKCCIRFSMTFYHPNNPFSWQKIQNSWGLIEAPHTFKNSFLNLFEHLSRGLYDCKSVKSILQDLLLCYYSRFMTKSPELIKLYCGFTDLQKQLLRPAGTPLREPLQSSMMTKKCFIMFSRTYYHPNKSVSLQKTQNIWVFLEAPHTFKNTVPRPTSNARGWPVFDKIEIFFLPEASPWSAAPKKPRESILLT